jgi:hypothetical protein
MSYDAEDYYYQVPAKPKEPKIGIGYIKQSRVNARFNIEAPVELSTSEFDAILKAKASIRNLAGATYSALSAALLDKSFIGDDKLGEAFRTSIISGGALLTEVFYALHKEKPEFKDIDIFNLSFPRHTVESIKGWIKEFGRMEAYKNSYVGSFYNTYFNAVKTINFIVCPPDLDPSITSDVNLDEMKLAEHIIDQFDMQISSMYYDYRSNRLHIPTRTMRCLLDKTTGLTKAFEKSTELIKGLSFFRLAKYAERFQIDGGLYYISENAPLEFERFWRERKMSPLESPNGSYSYSYSPAISIKEVE